MSALKEKSMSASESAKVSTNTSHEEELFLIDGSGFIFRAYHAIPMLNRADGTPVNAVLGFTNMLTKLIADMEVKSIAVIFDAARKNFRNDIYEDYKAHRPPAPDDLVPQFGLIREATEAFSIPQIEVEGYEADDIIATYARIAHEQGRKATIVSSDKDLMQLIRDDTIRMFDPIKYRYLNNDDVMKKFGVAPNKVIDVQSLCGDSVDNIPGVPGIGVKTAALLINEYGDLDTLLERADEIKQNKRRESLIEFADQARVSRQLVRLEDAVDVPMALDDLGIHDFELDKLLTFLTEQGFNSTVSRLSQKFNIPDITAPEEEDAPGYELVQDENALEGWIERAYEAGIVAVDTETTSLCPAKAKLCGISLSVKARGGCYIPLGHVDPNGYSDGFDFDSEPQESADQAPLVQLPLDRVMEMLKPLLENPGVMKVGQNIKYDLQMFYPHDIEIAPIDDTMVLSYVLDGSKHGHGMDELATLFLNTTTSKYTDICGKGKNQISFDEVPLDKALDYAAEDADITFRLHELFKPRLAKDKMATVYETLDRPLVPIIGRMEYTGIKIDPVVLKGMSQDFAQKLNTLEAEIFEMAGRAFNVGSPKQIGDVLFDEMGLTGGKKTKTGSWSTSVDVLEVLASEGHEIVEKILEWRSLSKLKSTYTDALPEQINPKTGRIHTSFGLTITNTGRLSSSDPNLQNVPIRTEAGRKIRTAFVPEDGYELLSVDYSQVELRLAAEMAGIKALQQAFKDGVDIHAMTASQVFDVPLDQMTPEIRRDAKAINFGIIYGISGFGLAKQLGISPKEAGAYIKAYLARFPELDQFMEAAREEARQHGYIKTLYGRKCVIKGINDKNGAIRQFAERQAINAPLQGTAADIMKRAMIQLSPALKDAGLGARMLLQVHDELLFEVPIAEKEQTEKLVIEIMQGAAKGLETPLLVEAGWGKNWAEAH